MSIAATVPHHSFTWVVCCFNRGIPYLHSESQHTTSTNSKIAMKNNLLFWSITVALAGFLFGFDTIVISGAEQALQELWQSSPTFHGLVVMSMALWGTVFGALLGNIPTDRIGRKNTLIFIGILYFVSALGSAMANNPYVFSFFRFIGGLGVGASTIAAPAYVSEIAPADKRGRLVAMYQFNIVFGILVAFISNFALAGIGENAWRWMMGVEAIPALIYTVLVFAVPRSPRWLMIQKNDEVGARDVLSKIYQGVEVDRMVTAMKEEIQLLGTKTQEKLFSKKYTKLIWLAFFLAFFNQVSGINAVLYYAPRIFETAGLGATTALLSGVGVGIVNLVFTMIGLNLIDRLGRRQLMFIGSYGYIISLLLVALAFFLSWKGIVVPIFLFVFIAAHAIGQGTVIWVFISEIFPNTIRAKGQSLGTGTHWVMAAIITLIMPPLLANLANPGFVFVIFALCMVGQLIWVWKIMPETKGVSLEDLEKQLVYHEETPD